MGYGQEYLDDHAYEIFTLQEFFKERLDETKKSLSKKADTELLKIAIKQGKDLNAVTDYFPAYDAALKIKKNGWKPTEKQRKAIINVVAFYITRAEFEED